MAVPGALKRGTAEGFEAAGLRSVGAVEATASVAGAAACALGRLAFSATVWTPGVVSRRRTTAEAPMTRSVSRASQMRGESFFMGRGGGENVLAANLGAPRRLLREPRDVLKSRRAKEEKAPRSKPHSEDPTCAGFGYIRRSSLSKRRLRVERRLSFVPRSSNELNRVALTIPAAGPGGASRYREARSVGRARLAA